MLYYASMHISRLRRGAVLGILFVPVLSFAATFSDTQNHQYQSQIMLLAEQGVVSGYPDGTFRPNDTINRAEFLKVLLRAVGQEVTSDSSRCFTDFVGPEEWYWSYACEAKAQGIIGGYPDGSFRGVQTVSVAEASKMVVQAAGFPLPQYVRAPDHWYDPYRDALATHIQGWASPSDPAHLLTRGEMAALMVSTGLVVSNGEGAQSSAASSSVSPGPSVCGNGIVESGEQCDDGNLQNGDGCSSLCIAVEQTVYHGSLRIEEHTTAGGAVAPGQKNVVLHEFTATAGRQDVVLTGLIFRAQSGDVGAAQNYRLKIDGQTVGTGIVEGSFISVDGMNKTLIRGVPTTVQLLADIRPTAQSQSLVMEFALNQEDFVQAANSTDGQSLTGITVNGSDCTEYSVCWIDVRTTDRVSLAVGASGNLYVTAAPQSGVRQVLAGVSPSEELLWLRLRTEGEDIRIKTMRFENVLSTASELRILADGSSTPLATATRSGCSPAASGNMCTSTPFTLPRNTEQILVVRALLKNDATGAQSGESSAITLAANGIDAEGVQSNKELATSDADATAEGEVFIGRSTAGLSSAIVGPARTVVFAELASVTNASTDADGTVVPTGQSVIGAFAFAAKENENTSGGRNTVLLRDLQFTVNATNVLFEASSFRLRNRLDPNTSLECSASGTTGSIVVTCTDIEQSALNAVIESGETLMLELTGNITNPQSADGSVLQVSLQEDIEWSDGVTVFTETDAVQTPVRSTTYRN